MKPCEQAAKKSAQNGAVSGENEHDGRHACALRACFKFSEYQSFSTHPIISTYAELINFPMACGLLAFEMLEWPSGELEKRFQMILGTPRLRAYVITTNMPRAALDHRDSGQSLQAAGAPSSSGTGRLEGYRKDQRPANVLFIFVNCLTNCLVQELLLTLQST